jgi:hypothetical protein
MTTTEFTTKTGNKISFFNIQEKECAVCQDIFLPKHPIAVYCDKKECNTHAYKRLNRPERESKVTCNICKKEYIPRSLNNVGHCGSMSCLYEYSHNDLHYLKNEVYILFYIYCKLLLILFLVDLVFYRRVYCIPSYHNKQQ